MKILDQAINKAQATIPMDLQIRGAHIYNKVRRAAFESARPPVFVEHQLPDVADLPLEKIDVSSPFLYRQNRWQSYFKRLRDEAPVHYQANSPFGPFWSITRYEDILFVDKNHELFSAEPFIVLGDAPKELSVEMFIAMDPPKHDIQRQAVQSVVAPKNLKEMEGLIRKRVADVLDNLPVDQPFDWVQHVSIELTARMLATLLDFPYEKRHKLVYWSDMAAASAETTGGPSDTDEMFIGVADMARQFTALWHDKAERTAAGEQPGFDLITLLQSHEATKDLIKRPMEFLGNLALLIVGGNDTTRNSMTGGVLALNRYPNEFAKLKADPALIPNMVSEIIRWQTPLAYMRRTATQDTELGGKQIKAGQKVVPWFASGNRNSAVFDDPYKFDVTRNPNEHMSFGRGGPHLCLGNALARLEIRIMFEDLLQRVDKVERVGDIDHLRSNFVNGIKRFPVKVTLR